MLQRFFKTRPAIVAGRALFKALSAQARQPVFYATLGVPDTVEGRFELYVLHLVLVLHRLKRRGGEAGEVSQATFDAFLRNLDEGLRDMGVGDLSVGKKMRKLGEAVYGRIKGYDKVLAGPDSTPGLEALIARTVYRDQAPAGAAEAIARYVEASVVSLGAQPLAQVLACEIIWPPIDGLETR